jgi:Uma2 family endonuclease
VTFASPEIDFTSVQHLTLSNVSWDFYEHLLAEIGDGATRVTYLNGDIEIMSPLPKHATWGFRLARVIELMALEREISLEGLGSTTFRDKAQQLGLEPDECYYVRDLEAVKQLEEAWNPKTDPPPNLALEIDVTRRSIEREPIYAGLRIAELWRFDGTRLTVRLLDKAGTYRTADRSEIFPFLPMEGLVQYVRRLAKEPQLPVLNEFRQWVRTL